MRSLAVTEFRFIRLLSSDSLKDTTNETVNVFHCESKKIREKYRCFTINTVCIRRKSKAVFGLYIYMRKNVICLNIHEMPESKQMIDKGHLQLVSNTKAIKSNLKGLGRA